MRRAMSSDAQGSLLSAVLREPCVPWDQINIVNKHVPYLNYYTTSLTNNPLSISTLQSWTQRGSCNIKYHMPRRTGWEFCHSGIIVLVHILCLLGKNLCFKREDKISHVSVLPEPATISFATIPSLEALAHLPSIVPDSTNYNSQGSSSLRYALSQCHGAGVLRANCLGRADVSQATLLDLEYLLIKSVHMVFPLWPNLWYPFLVFFHFFAHENNQTG